MNVAVPEHNVRDELRKMKSWRVKVHTRQSFRGYNGESSIDLTYNKKPLHGWNRKAMSLVL